MTKHRLTQEDKKLAQDVYTEVEVSLRRLVEFLNEHGYDKFTNRFGSSQLVTVKANDSTGHNGVHVVRIVIPNTTGEWHDGPLESDVRLVVKKPRAKKDV